MIRLIVLVSTLLGSILCGGLNAQPLTLDQLESMALAHNPTLSEAAAQVRAAAGRLRQAGLYPNPLAGYRGEQIRGGQQAGGEEGFFVSQTIVLGGKLGAGRRIASRQREQAETGLELQRARVRNNVRALYYQALAAQRLVEVRRSLAALAQDAVETSKQLGNVGQADRPDILQAEVEVEQASLDAGAALQSQQTIWRTLAVTTGNPDLPFSGLQGDLEAFPNLDLNKSLDAALAESPAIRLVSEDVERAQAAVALARKAPIPDLQISGGLEQNFEPLGPGQRPVGLQGFAEAGVRLPLFNRNQGDVESARAEVERAKSEVGRARLQLRREIGLLFGDYAIARAAAGRYKSDLLPRARKAYDLYRHNYQSMAAAYPQVLIAQRTLFQLEAGYIQALDRVWQTALSIQGFALTDGLAEP